MTVATSGSRMGRASVFRGKENGVRVQGIITKTGGQMFETQRRKLSALYAAIMRRRPATVSDADVIEYMARGDGLTALYLRKLKREEDTRT